MIRSTGDELLFSVKSYLGAMLALYLSYRIGLTRPFLALTTAYIVTQPWSNTVRSKAVYRLCGTFWARPSTCFWCRAWPTRRCC